MMSRSAEPKLLCRPVVRALMAENDWRLLSEDEFVEAVAGRLPPQGAPGPETVRKWAVNTYCRLALYPGCLGAQGRRKQERGFEELAIYLYRLAHWKWPQVAEDAVQEALYQIYEKMDHVRNPGAFLAFAIQKLRDAARKYINQETRAESLEELLETVKLEGAGIETPTACKELRRQVIARLAEIRRQHPRARRQLYAVCLRYFREQSTEEIAAILKTTSDNVYVLINRGLEKLRADKPLRELAQEILAQC